MGTEAGKSAAVLAVGDELLSGRTRDANINTLALWLGERGVRLCEARIVADVEGAIVDAVRALSDAHDYVFTTGGIGPTHDDITADAVAKAFERALPIHEEALRRLTEYIGADEMNDARRRMARIPEGASLIDNPVSVAPGFQIENVFVMAGVPKVMQGMLADIDHRIEHGRKSVARYVTGAVREGDISAPLAALDAETPGVAFGSYPTMEGGAPRVTIAARGLDAAEVERAIKRAGDLMRTLGAEPVFEDREPQGASNRPGDWKALV